MEIGKTYPEYYRTPRAPDFDVGQRGSPAFIGKAYNDFSPQGNLSGVKTDVFEARQAVNKIRQLDKKVSANPFTACISIPPMQRNQRHNQVMEFLKSPDGRATMAVGGILPMIRRDQSAIDKYEQGNNVGAGLVVAMGLANLPGDITQVGLAARDGKEAFKALLKGELSTIPKRELLRECSFFRGTFLEKIFNPYLKKYAWLENLDKSILDTKFGESALKFLKTDIEEVKTIKGVSKNASDIMAVKLSGNSLQKVLAGSLLRLSPLSLITSAAIEIPALIKSITETDGNFSDKAGAFGKQLFKSAVFVGIINAGIAVGATALALTPFGAAAELLGMAIGSVAGLMASRAVNKGIDNIFKPKESVA